MTTRLKILISICGALVLILAFTRFGSYKDGAATAIIGKEKARIEAKHLADIKDLKDQVAAKQAELSQSEKRAATYREKLAVAEARLRMILLPETAAEAKQRLRGLGYEVR
jgi:flagellar motility protein MotE (MotC chaperone)